MKKSILVIGVASLAFAAGAQLVVSPPPPPPPLSAVVPCMECKGTGRIPQLLGLSRVCPVCAGAGTVAAVVAPGAVGGPGVVAPGAVGGPGVVAPGAVGGPGVVAPGRPGRGPDGRGVLQEIGHEATKREITRGKAAEGMMQQRTHAVQTVGHQGAMRNKAGYDAMKRGSGTAGKLPQSGKGKRMPSSGKGAPKY